MTELQSIRALRDYSLKLQPNIRRKVNKLTDVIESDIAELESLVRDLDYCRNVGWCCYCKHDLGDGDERDTCDLRLIERVHELGIEVDA